MRVTLGRVEHGGSGTPLDEVGIALDALNLLGMGGRELLLAL